MMEAGGTDPEATARMYLNSGVLLANAIDGDNRARSFEQERLAAQVNDFARARAMRLLIVMDTPSALSGVITGTSYWCWRVDDEACSGSLSTYDAIRHYLDGSYHEAVAAGLNALSRRQPWTYDSLYEHPLLWTLAAARRRGDADTADELRDLIDVALASWPEDARAALHALVEPEDTPDEDACTTAGCHYFMAETYDIARNGEGRDEMIAAGLELCDSVYSMPCTALRAARGDLAASAEP
jgi:hypothetical protein